MKRIVIVLFCLEVLLYGGDKKAPAPVVVIEQPGSYPFPPDLKAKIRDLQYENDQLEIEIQKLQVKQEQDRQKQLQLVEQLRNVAFEYATQKKIDLSLYELDTGEVKFVPKKSTK